MIVIWLQWGSKNSKTRYGPFKTGYKKALSSLNQAALMNLALADYDFASFLIYLHLRAFMLVSKIY